jgi:transcriptional regulator
MLVLKTLARGPNHGYGIAQHIHRISGEALTIGEGSLYPALQRLLVNAWVRAEWTASETGRKVRQYSITAAGRKQLARETRDFGYLVAAIARVMEGA